MFIGNTDTCLRVADSLIKERHAEAARLRSIRTLRAESDRPERRLPRISLRLPRFELLRRTEATRTRTA